MLEEGSEEEDHGQEEGFECVGDGEGPDAHEVEGVER